MANDDDFDPTEVDRRASDYVRSGFHGRDDIIQMIMDTFEDDVDAGKLRLLAVRAVDEAIEEQQRAEATWDPLTDCDRLDLAFDQLEDSGIVARQNFTCCQNCGHAEIGDEIAYVAERGTKVRGYTFYHWQDTDRAVEGDGLFLAYGVVGEEQEILKIAGEVVAALERCGLKTDWDGSEKQRIGVALEWRRAVSASVMAKRRGLFALGAVLLALVFWFWTGEQPAVRAAPPTAGDCEQIEVWNNGFHTDLIMPASLLPADHPLRQLDPNARYLLVGWGDEAFFRSDGTNMLLGLKALLPGGAVTMHVVYADVPVEQVYLPKDVTPLAISHAGAAALAKRFADTLVLDKMGRVQIIEQGHAGPRSWFLKARGEFDLFTICNQWTARSLRMAGVHVNAAFVYFGDWLVALLKPARHVCPS